MLMKPILLVHLDTETTGLSDTDHGVHSLGFIGEVVTSDGTITKGNPEYLGYWEFNPVGRKRDDYALKVGHTTHEELDARPSHKEFGEDILTAIDEMVEDAKMRYEGIRVFMVGSYPQFDVRMIDGMDWDWKMARWFGDGNLVNTKTFIEDLQGRKLYNGTTRKLQDFIDGLNLRGKVVNEIKLLSEAKLRRYGNADPLIVAKPHTAIYDCVCTLVATRTSAELIEEQVKKDIPKVIAEVWNSNAKAEKAVADAQAQVVEALKGSL